MSEQERPSGRPQNNQDFSLRSLGEDPDSDGRDVTSARPRKTTSRPFDPTQYVQGRPAGNAQEDGRNNRRNTPEEVDLEDLPPPSYQPKNTPRIESTRPSSEDSGSSTTDRIYVRPETQVSDSDCVFPRPDHEETLSDSESTATEPPSRSMAKTFNILGAATSIALVCGLGFWGYKLAVRDVSGIPVVAALEGPMRVQPEDPGGELATHKGLAVNVVQAEGEAEATADRLVLAPQPVEVREGDGVLTAPVEVPTDTAPPAKLTSTTPQVPVKAEAPDQKPLASANPTQSSEEVVKPAEAVKIAAPKQEVVIEAPAALDVAAAANKAVLEVAKNSEVVPETPPSDKNVVVISQSIPGVKKSLRPEPRPSDLAERVASVRTQTVEPEATVQSPDAQTDALLEGEIDPESLVVGTNLAQLGAYPNAQVARAEWDKKAARFEDYMEDKSRVIQKAESGGRAFYRLRAHGFETIGESRQFCAALQAEGAECISVVVRK